MLTITFVHRVVLLCVHMMIEGGFHPGPLVKVSGDDTTAAHVRLIPPSFPMRAFGSKTTMMTISMLHSFSSNKQQTYGRLNPSHIDSNLYISTFTCGKVRNNREQE